MAINSAVAGSTAMREDGCKQNAPPVGVSDTGIGTTFVSSGIIVSIHGGNGGDASGSGSAASVLPSEIAGAPPSPSPASRDEQPAAAAAAAKIKVERRFSARALACIIGRP
jgi:hypothetical protein